jgi:hypothetical protein
MSDTPIKTQAEAQGLIDRIKRTPLAGVGVLSPRDDPSARELFGDEPMPATAPAMQTTAPPADPPSEQSITWPLTAAPEGEPIDPMPGRYENESRQDYYKRNPSMLPKPAKQLPMPPGDTPADQAATWKLIGKPGPGSDGRGVILAYSSTERPELHWRMRASRKITAERNDYKDLLESRFRGQVLATLQGAEAFRRHQQILPQHSAACQASADAQAHLTTLQDKLAALHRANPIPPNLASQLVILNAEIVQARNNVEQTAAEQAALTPLYLRARADVDNLVPGIASAAWRLGDDQFKQELQTLLETFFEKNNDLLTQIASLMSGRNGLPMGGAEGFARQMINEACKE